MWPLVRPASVGDESVTGYLLRVAESNGYSHPLLFLSLAQQSDAKGGLGWIVSFLHAHDGNRHVLAGLTMQCIRSWAQGSTIKMPNARFLTVSHARCCPCCLREAGYWRVAWEYEFSLYCPRHNVWLVHHCPECSQLLSMWRWSVSRCKCGMLLSRLQAESVDVTTDVGLQLADVVLLKSENFLPLEMRGSNDVLPSDFQNLSSDQLHKLVHFLGAYVSKQNLIKPRKILLKGEPRKMWRLLTAAATLLKEWPTGFHGFLSALLAENKDKAGIRQRFGYLYTALYREFGEPAFDFLRLEFESFLHERWDDVLSGRNRRLSSELKESQGYLPASSVMRLLSVPRHVLETGIVKGTLQGRITRLPSGRQRIVVAKTDLARIPALWDWLDLKATTQLLGLTERRVRELLAADVLRGKAPEAGETWKIQRSDIEQMLAELRTVSVTCLVSSQGLVRLDAVLRHYLKSETSFVELFSALRSGDIPFEWKADSAGLGGIWLDKAKLKSWLQPAGDRVGVPALAMLLGIKQEVAYHIVRRQLVLAEGHGNKGLLIEQTEVKRFQSEYVLARDLAQMLRTSPRYLIQRLTAAGVVPVTGPTVDGCRQVIYLRASLSHLPIPASIARALDQLGNGKEFRLENRRPH